MQLLEFVTVSADMVRQMVKNVEKKVAREGAVHVEPSYVNEYGWLVFECFDPADRRVGMYMISPDGLGEYHPLY